MNLSKRLLVVILDSPYTPPLLQHNIVCLKLFEIYTVPLVSSQRNYDLDELGIMTLRPWYPKFATEVSRQKSFDNNWPSTKVQTPRQLSEAGFFYIGDYETM